MQIAVRKVRLCSVFCFLRDKQSSTLHCFVSDCHRSFAWVAEMACMPR
jgi:hypothetical protein